VGRGPPAAPPALQLDDGRELAPRRMPDQHQLALDDDRRGRVQPLVILGGVERHDAQTAGRALGLDLPDAGNIIGP
jgi:hypothetical protein